MREEFPGYYRPSKGALKELWENCFFILDTNVILDLYRYPQQTREELLGLLRRISDRLWIPHQVALEYQENRLAVIAEQVKRYDEVVSTLEKFQKDLDTNLGNLQLKKRHSTINPDKLIGSINEAIRGFIDEVQELKKAQPNVHEEDVLRDELDAILVGKVGKGPASQDELDKIYDQGKIRYERLQPPGYKDQKKSKEEKASYLHNGLIYEREYGDLILWFQILEEVKKREISHVIFVTNDEKEDWWWFYQSGGEKTLGPRRELVEEINLKAGVSSFHMYNTERLLLFAQDYFSVQVSQETIDHVRDISHVRSQGALYVVYEEKVKLVKEAVLSWLEELYFEDYIILNDNFPDFIITSASTGKRLGYEVKYFDDPLMLSRLQDFIYRAYSEANNSYFDVIYIVAVIEKEMYRKLLMSAAKKLLIQTKHVGMVIGTLEFSSESEGSSELRFKPLYKSADPTDS